MENPEYFTIEVAYALPDEQVILEVNIDASTTVKQAIEQSGVLEMYPDIDLGKQRVGIFSKPAKLDATLSEGDRIEIYRPLIADPKEVRRQRAAEGKATKKGVRET